MFQPLPSRREGKVFAGSAWVNEIVDSVRSLGQVNHGTSRDVRDYGFAVYVKPKTNLAGGGKYMGVFMEPPQSTLNLTDDLSSADAGFEGAPCIIFNRAEKAQSTHALTSADNNVTEFIGMIIGYIGGMPVVEITGYALKLCPAEFL